MSPRVLHVVVAGEIGGAERMLVSLASRPADTEATHAVALMTPNEGLARLFTNAGLAVFDRGRVRENPGAFLWRSFGPTDTRWLADVMARTHSHVAHLHTFGSHVVGTRAARQAGIPVVRTEHSTRVYDDPSCWPFSRWSLRHSDAAVAISAHVERVAAAKAPWARAKLRVVRNGVDTDRFAPRDTTWSDAYTFVLIGRLEPRKGIDVALDALAQVPKAHLIVVGDGEERARLEQHTRDRSLTARVQFLGYLDDPRHVIAACDAILCSSRQEGLGLALLEGMAMGHPVVTVPVGGVPEIVKDGETGFVARAQGAEALAERMRDAVAARVRLREMGRAARAFVVQHASVRSMCEGYRDVYTSLAKPRH